MSSPIAWKKSSGPLTRNLGIRKPLKSRDESAENDLLGDACDEPQGRLFLPDIRYFGPLGSRSVSKLQPGELWPGDERSQWVDFIHRRPSWPVTPGKWGRLHRSNDTTVGLVITVRATHDIAATSARMSRRPNLQRYHVRAVRGGLQGVRGTYRDYDRRSAKKRALDLLLHQNGQFPANRFFKRLSRHAQ